MTSKPKYSAEYYLQIPSAQLTSALAADSVIFAMRNGTQTSIRIKQIYIRLGFSGTAAASTSSIQLRRFSAATPTGGTALYAVKKATSQGPPSLADARYNYGAALTITSVVQEEPFAVCGNARQLASQSMLDFKPTDNTEHILELAPGEGLLFRLGVAAVVGDNLGGFIRWIEQD